MPTHKVRLRQNSSDDDYKSNFFPMPAPGTSTALTASSGMRRMHKILSEEEIAQGKTTRWLELEITGKVKYISNDLLKFRHLTALFLNGNQITRVPPEIRALSNLQILDLSHNKLRSLPAELGDMATLIHLYLNYNLLRVLPYEIGKLCRLQSLGLHGNPLNSELQKIYNEKNGTVKVLKYFLDNLHINASPPPPRPWVPLTANASNPSLAKFTVLCYNILCDKYATSTVYSYCPSWALDWSYRREKILDEIRSYNADVVTLQEVETGEFHEFFKPALASRGYEGIFSPKSRARTMHEDERRFVDGCAIFWKSEKFKFEREHLIEFTQLAIDKAGGSERMLNRVMTRDNIALVAVLRMQDRVYDTHYTVPLSESVVGDPLVVCTAHIHWDPEYCDVKLVQSMMLVQELGGILEQTARDWGASQRRPITTKDIPFLICGDLNSLPQSGVFEYLTMGKISTNHKDFQEFRGDTCLQKLNSAPGLEGYYAHTLQMTSAYSPEMMPFTNYTFDFKGMIDYVFASRRNLERLALLGPLDADWFQENKVLGCPHPMIPSDHFPLMAMYALLPRSLRPTPT